MRDKYTKQRISQLHPRLRKEAQEAILEAERALPTNVSIRLTSVYRSFSEQDKLFNQKPKVTNAKGGQSYHNYGLAIDFVLMIDNKVADWSTTKDRDKDGTSDWNEVINAFTKRGWKSGAHFKGLRDYPHLEKTFGNSWQQLLSRLLAGDTFKDNGIEYVNID